MTKTEYRDVYLKSAHWIETARRKRAEVGGRCERCGRRPNGPLDVHHLPGAYRNLYCESMTDLEVMCRDCHDYEHGNVLSLAELARKCADPRTWGV